MKSYFIYFIVICTILVFISCNKSSPNVIQHVEENQQFKSKEIYLDSNFKNLVNQEDELRGILIAISKDKKITADSLAIEIEKIKVSSKDSIELRIKINNLG